MSDRPEKPNPARTSRAGRPRGAAARGASPWVVLKFGGTSVGSARNWTHIQQAIEHQRAAGRRVLVVLSAVSGISNLLVGVARRFARGEASQDLLDTFRERHQALAGLLGIAADEEIEEALERLVQIGKQAESSGFEATQHIPRILCEGELLSTVIGRAFLERRELTCARLDARDVLSSLPGATQADPSLASLEAHCDYAPAPALERRLERLGAPVVLTQGFIARSPYGQTVLLGRGGSDTAAAYLAAKLGAERLIIYTDVRGVLSGDPRRVANAHRLTQLDYDEAQCLAEAGAKVLHPRCVAPARESGTPMEIRRTREPLLPGTEVSAEAHAVGVKAVVSRDQVALVTVADDDEVGVRSPLADISACLEAHALPIDIVSRGAARTRLLVDLSQAGAEGRLTTALEELEQGHEVTVDRDVASLALVGRDVQSSMSEFGAAFEAISQTRVELMSHCPAGLRWTVVIARDRLDDVLKRTHAALFGDDATSSSSAPESNAALFDAPLARGSAIST